MPEPVEILSMPEAARRLGMRTHELVRLAYEGRIEFVTVEGIWHIPDTVIERYRQQAS